MAKGQERPQPPKDDQPDTGPTGPTQVEPLWTTNEARSYLNVSRTKLWQLVNEGGLPAYRIGGDYRYRKSEIDAWLEAQRHKPGSSSSPE
jgi:excisionase family DNA binding protein